MCGIKEELAARLTLEQLAREKVYIGNGRDYTWEAFKFINTLPLSVVRQTLIKFYYDRVRMYEGIKRQMND